jgi:glycosyltransferase involved in cell wall biosynthesis
MHGYWGARGLAERGHQVFVVTNANEIEETFRIRISPADLGEGGEYARSFPETGGRVEVHSTEPPDRSHLYYIPMGNPTVTRLATMATDTIRKHDCKIIYSYYLEPYGMAAHLASAWTGVPYIVKHAGSDLNRLLPLEELKTAYLEVLGRANRVVSRGPSRQQLISLGVDEDRIDARVAFGLPERYFHPDAPRMDINSCLAELAETQTEEEQAAGRYAPIDDRLPVIGIYGKLGLYKGSFDLVNAMTRVIRSGTPFYLVAVSHGWQEKTFWRYVAEAGIGQYIRMLPFMPHWKIPSFIRACTAITFLERDFPISAHTPTIPSEIIQTGCCAIVSEEVIRKQLFRTRVRDRQNLLVVPDPKDHQALAARLRYAIESPERAAEIGRRGFEDLGGGHGYEAYIDALEALLTEVSAEAPAARSLGTSMARRMPAPLELVQTLFPSTYAVLRPELRPGVEAAVVALDLSSGHRAAIAAAIGDVLEAKLTEAADAQPSAPMELCRYERKLHRWSKMSNTSSADRRPGEVRFTVADLGPLTPVIHDEWELATFACDVEAIAAAISRKEQISVSRKVVKILFRRGSLPLLVNEATETLLRLVEELQGTASTQHLFDLLSQIFDQESASGRSDLSSSCLAVLEGLYWEGILDFEPAPRPGEQTAA